MSQPAAIGRYTVLSPLGQGGMGRVFLAEDPLLRRQVAIKLLPDEYRADPGRRERLLQEARAASSLNHPNIVTIHDLGESEAGMFVAMEHIQGETLQLWARRRHDPVETLALMRQATRALDAAHRAGLVHRDLKPQNLMVRPDGTLKVLDFGLARTVAPAETDATRTLPGMLIGTLPYMAPEQVLGQPATPASDLFSLGVILYELFTGTHPFVAESWIETTNRILHEDPAPPSRLAPTLGPEFDFVLAKVLAKEPGRRPASAGDLENDLAALDARLRPGTPSSHPRAGGTRSLAVLPFKNIGGNPDLAYLAMGLADAVITQLATSPDLIVRATSAIAAYENRPVDPRRVGEELEVDAVLDASFQLVAGRLRATARLVEAASGRMLWGGKVDVASEDVFELQDRVAHGIAEALTGRISAPARPAFTPSPQAYDQFLRGMDGYRRFEADVIHEAIAHFEEAVRLEPGFARAWAMLGEARQWVAAMGWDADPIWFARGEEALARARALDPGDAMVHYLSATLHIARGRPREAYADLRVALAGMPHFAHVYHYFSYTFRLCDLLDRAVDAETRCWEIDGGDPFPYANMIWIQALQGDFAGSGEWLERARLRFAKGAGVERAEIASLCVAGRFEEALERHGGLEQHGLPLGNVNLALAALRLGHAERARRLFEQSEGFARMDMDAAGWAAAYMAWAGDRERAFQYLSRASELGLHSATFYEHPQLFGPLHDDPRWPTFISGIRERVAGYRRDLLWPPRGA
jgi:TolB-like protein/tetratricopeptide (TPR) repeat protein